MVKAEDKFALRKKADSNVISIIANKILLDTNYEEAEKVDSDPEIRSLLVIAERLHLTIQQVLDMPVSHYNLWLAYLKKESDQYKTKQQLRKQESLNNGKSKINIDIIAR